jgi:hypothetical protein
MPTVLQLAAAIEKMEGYHAGSRSFRNNNPGNLRFARQPGAVDHDDKGFAVFETFEKGQAALIALLEHYRSKYPTWTVAQLINTYAPPSENDTAHYSQMVAYSLRVGTDFPIGSLES